MNAKTEKIIERNIITAIRAVGGWATKVQSGAMMKGYQNKKTGVYKMYRMQLASRGTPDILACLSGRFVAIEVKASPQLVEKWKLSHSARDERTTAQQNQAKDIEQCGGLFIITSSYEEVLNILYENGLISKPSLC